MRQAELEGLDPVGYAGVNVTSAGLSAQYEKMWRVSFVGSTVEGDVEAMQVVVTAVRPFEIIVVLTGCRIGDSRELSKFRHHASSCVCLYKRKSMR